VRVPGVQLLIPCQGSLGKVRETPSAVGGCPPAQNRFGFMFPGGHKLSKCWEPRASSKLASRLGPGFRDSPTSHEPENKFRMLARAGSGL